MRLKDFATRLKIRDFALAVPFAAALLSCNRQEITPAVPEEGPADTYKVVIYPLIDTKGSSQLCLGDSDTYIATLYRNGVKQDWDTWSWSGDGCISTRTSTSSLVVADAVAQGTGSITARVGGNHPAYGLNAVKFINVITPEPDPGPAAWTISTATQGNTDHGYLVSVKIKNIGGSIGTCHYHMIHRYNHTSTTTEGDKSVTLGSGEQRQIAMIEFGNDSYIRVSGDVTLDGGDGDLSPTD